MPTYSVGQFTRREIMRMSAALAGTGVFLSGSAAFAQQILRRTPNQILGPFYPLGSLDQNAESNKGARSARAS